MYSRGKIIAKLVYALDQMHCQQNIGDILITANKDVAYNSEAFAQALRKFKSKILHKLFASGASVITRSDNGRLHCHIAATISDKCTQFDWISFEQSERYYKLYTKYKSKADLLFYKYYTKKYRDSLPQSWKVINRKLTIAGKRYKLGRVFLTPIRKNTTAYKWYLVGNVPRKRDKRDSGLHFFNSWGLQTAQQFQLSNKYTACYRDKLRKFCQGLQLTSENYNIYLRSILGKSWYFKIKDMVKDVDSLNHDQKLRYANLQSALNMHILRSL